MREVIRQLFPRLRDDQAEITSPHDFRYNCVAWAAGDVSRWWWPTEPAVAYWPDGVAREETVCLYRTTTPAGTTMRALGFVCIRSTATPFSRFIV
jgi:hypothetical protein